LASPRRCAARSAASPGPAQHPGRRLDGADRRGQPRRGHSILQRIRELAVEYRNGSLSTAGKGAIQSEVDQLSAEITRIGNAAVFNGVSLLSAASTVTFQVGANDNETIAISFLEPHHRRRHRYSNMARPAWPPSTPRSTR
jgi:hypothetical protein